MAMVAGGSALIGGEAGRAAVDGLRRATAAAAADPQPLAALPGHPHTHL
jgi:hypothetical protein